MTFLKRVAGYIFKIAEGNLVFYKTEKLINADSAKILYKSDLSTIDNYTATRSNLRELIKLCDTNQRYIYKVIKKHAEGNRGKKS